jgi:hypothetical protein
MQTFVGNNNNEVQPDLAQKLAAGLGGPELMISMFDSVATLLEAHHAPDSVKQKFSEFAHSIEDWARALSTPPTPAPSHDAAPDGQAPSVT